MLPILIDKDTEIIISITPSITEMEMKAKRKDSTLLDTKLFVFPNGNEDKYEIIIRKKKDD